METGTLKGKLGYASQVPPSGGSLEIGNWANPGMLVAVDEDVPPSGGSLEIGNADLREYLRYFTNVLVPPSGGSLEIGNWSLHLRTRTSTFSFPLRGDP